MAVIDISSALAHAIERHRAGQSAEAESLYNQILLQCPTHADALHLLGVLMGQTGRLESGVDLIKRAVAIDPGRAEYHYNLGNLYEQIGRRNEAVSSFRTASLLKPDFADAHYNLSLLLAGLEEIDEAIASADCAVKLRPEHARSHYARGVALMKKSLTADAIAAFRNALNLNPELIEAHSCLGACLAKLSDTASAVLAFQYAASLKPNDAEIQCNLGRALIEDMRPMEAEVIFRRAIELDSKSAAAYRGLGEALATRGKTEDAIAALDTAGDLAPNLVTRPYERASMGIGPPPSTLPRDYVAKMFDDCSEIFEQHLTQTLNYVGPQLLFEQVTPAAPTVPMDILDLGCGTGLCGQLFRRMARRLVGVDLSPRMVQQARHCGVYDEVREDELLPVIKDRPNAFDLILAADVFIYVGELWDVFEASARALRPGGLMAFTIESVESGDYVLRRSLRYAHSMSYIRRLAETCGFEEVSARPCILRNESRKPMHGYVVVLRLSSPKLA
jgi:predicted TPR repeat methyltransferase